VTSETMTTGAITILFVLMLAAPCVIGFCNTRNLDEPDLPIEMEEIVAAADFVAKPLAVVAPVAAVRERSLAELATDAEAAAMLAQETARQAHWAALAAASRAARLRADAAVEIALETGKEFAEALRAADGEYFPGRYPSDDLPPRKQGRAA
jgi:hypothetical protein